MFQSKRKVEKIFWRVAAIGAGCAVLLMSGINGVLLETGFGNVLEFIFGALFGLVAVSVFAVIVAAFIRLAGGIPTSAVAIISGAVLALWFLSEYRFAELLRGLLDTDNWSWPLAVPDALSVLPLASIVLAVASLSGLAAMFVGKSMRRLYPRFRIGLWLFTIGFTGIAIAVVLRLASDGEDPFPNDGAPTSAVAGAAQLPDPAARGIYAIEHLTYGAGENSRRPEFGAERDLQSRTVNIAALLPEWKEFRQRMRERYWGISLEEAPLNGQVWAPEDSGPFPLVLLVHGNHRMEDYSDSGYAYLGELLANRGFIAVSIDQNYINASWSGDFEGKEMAARAGLLLEHLALWRDWNETVGHPFYARVDMDNIALMGHSRGGEAVSIAYAFNGLPNFPDDATVEFDYGFNIRSLVAIAQIDQRYHRRLEIDNVNFFTIHGSYDSDEPAYHGLRQLNRITLDDDDYYINAGVYLHGANHGQFNTGWGRTDYSPPGSWRLNLAPIIPGEEQRRVASAFIVAFLETTLHGDERFVALLKDPRAGAQWLPARTYVHQFTDSTFRPLADFEEDLDVTSATQAGATISANALVLWREEDLQHRDERKQGSNGVVLGWRDENAEYSLNLASADDISPERALVFAVSGSLEELPAEDGDEEEDTEDEEVEPAIADFSIALRDAAGHTSAVLASQHARLVPPVRVRYLKNEALNEELYNADWEPVLQFVEIPFNAFVVDNPGLDLSTTRTILFRFDQAPEGVLIFDKIGTMSLEPLPEQ